MKIVDEADQEAPDLDEKLKADEATSEDQSVFWLSQHARPVSHILTWQRKVWKRLQKRKDVSLK